MSARLRPAELLSRLNSSYWFVPLLVTLAGIAAAVALLASDARIVLDASRWYALPLTRSADGARALLSAVIGAMITAISVTFSVTIVALTVAAQHFGPRVLNNFVRHTAAQVVLGTFMATFSYSVLVLGAIDESGSDARVPQLAVLGAILLVATSIGALIYYVQHVSTSLQIGELAAEIAKDFKDAVSRLRRGEELATGAHPEPILEAPEDAAEIRARETGYVQRIDYEAIVESAAARGAVVWIRREPGAFVIAGSPLALVHPGAACDEMLSRNVRDACVFGRDRTLWQDAEFAVKQLVEIALRALSPGVNEPFTAITCIDRLTEGLAAAAAAPRPRGSWPDASGHVRVFSAVQPFETLLRAAFDPIRIFAGTNPAIYARLLDSVTELGFIAAREPDLAALRHQAELVRRTAERNLPGDDERRFVESRYEHTLRQFGRGASGTRK